ncbi:Uma2 family endonuclease [Allostreptomyces psammosilenae]|uniref:Uma2 family endonuclease n=1 Tax=Allostreptomyces psammosilenae TaxID=1892865 RepID=A0A852ZZU8_9ACTN|nr:Uma2 family endonuclease [Allostreptomyces psammosilenae]NYI07645.1 Uma2 family endonuclease [Allostreptomyces psammosilenae]
MSAVEDHAGAWTIEDVLALEDDGKHRFELWGDALVMSPAAGFKHQRASRRLANLLEAAAEAAGAPVEVLEAVNVVLPSGMCVPDIAVVENAAAATDPVTVDAEAVWLVVEIVSPSPAGRRIDRMVKPLLYAEGVIPGYWRLELQPVPELVVAEWQDGRYVERLVAEPNRTTLIEKPFPVSVDPMDLVRPARG